jgi:pyridoxal phosphate enzyme (YggS family)
MIDLTANLSDVQGRIAAAARRAGRGAEDVTLVAVTKTQPPEIIRAAYELGLRHFGENRVGEAAEKVGGLPEAISWHMIGHIQSRKAKQVAPIFQVVHSVDRVKIARALDRHHPDGAEPLPVLLECNVSGEGSKYGFTADRWDADQRLLDKAQRQALHAAVDQILALPNLRVEGLMTMAPIVDDPAQARPVFARLRRLRDHLAETFPSRSWHHLSMGMTDDFEVAIEEGATLVRVGRAIFGPWRTSQ